MVYIFKGARNLTKAYVFHNISPSFEPKFLINGTKTMPTFTPHDLNEQLREAARSGDCAKIRLLVMSGADVDVRDEEGWTAFNIATAAGQNQAATTLLAARQLSYIRKMGVDAQDFYEAPAKRRVA